jgi:predicted RNA-binding protein with PIN domain
VSARLIIVDGYNLIHRSDALKPGPGRTLEQSRDKLLNLLTWAFGTGDARFIVIFDGANVRGGSEGTDRVEVRYSKPPRSADDDIKSLVEQRVGGNERVTVVTSDLDIARHARAMGADVSLADLFLASALGPGSAEDPEKPVQLSKKEIEDWAEIFKQRPDSESDELH